jgi:hypothetical protein
VVIGDGNYEYDSCGESCNTFCEKKIDQKRTI